MTQKIVNVVKGLIVDGIAKARSGHPGGAMSSADFLTVLYKDFLRFDPNDDMWINRDRFVLAAGHESMLLYSLLHLNGTINLDALKNFRQLHSITPGHPEFGETKGIDATSGPLGQGIGMAVGMAVAECFLRAKTDKSVIDHYTYVLTSDGDLQEPVALGSASLAGLWQLGKIIAFYDANKIQLSGPVKSSDITNYKQVFEGFGWHVLEIDGHDHSAIKDAIKKSQEETSRPSLIIGNTTMAKGAATVEGDHNTHGAPLSAEEISATKIKLGLDKDKDFFVPEEIYTVFQKRNAELTENAKNWKKNFQDKNAQFKDFWDCISLARKDKKLSFPEFTENESIATRSAWGKCLNELIDQLPNLLGGSADLDPSNQTAHFRKTVGEFSATNPLNRNLTFGVREFPMATILNGLALHGGIIPFGATFLTFSDYCKNAMRMSALQKLPVLYVYTHDSFHVGEDGPTHQPIEHISSLRLIPNLIDMRPADANETALCLQFALKEEHSPVALMLTRQNLPVLAKTKNMQEGIKRGAYVLKDCDGTADIILIASGSEVSLALETAKLLAPKKVRVVSMPSMVLFNRQDENYKESVLPKNVTRRAAAEAGRTDMWYRYVGIDGLVLGLDTFGASAPAEELAKFYGFTPENFAKQITDKFFK